MARDGRRALALTAALGAGIAVLACRRVDPDARSASAGASSAQLASASATNTRSSSPSAAAAPTKAVPEEAHDEKTPGELAALDGERVVHLDVPGFQPAVVAVPIGARRPKPVVLALHGNFDRPEWQCSVFGPIVASRAFVLCPRGRARSDVPKSLDRWDYASQRAMTKEIDAALSALAAHFGAHVDPGPKLFIGFSLGAIYGVGLVQKEPQAYPRAVFIEGALGAWSRAAAKGFVEHGGARVLFACGQADCMRRIKTLVPALEKAGLPTRAGGSANAGHTYDGVVADVVAENFEWLVEGDARFSE